ncbi:Hsp70 family protein [Calycomorphotria hydatis]|uniref:Chaperone protein HscC n=1 Tax=Calycomorphotria hydatis TaxID=2528027 RepID=A0A517TB04_9PLAN|nr:Hsp70 family protein [Calycomorphotria hydatis]QDT65549.1 Chaperone protein HscC [Calycomorphotria hydatis]
MQIIGIDLGTTNSLVAYLDTDGPRMIPNALGEVLTPSAVGVDSDGQVIVGRPAKELATISPERAAVAFKRHMGSDWNCSLGSKKYDSTELSAMVLRSLKNDAEAHFGLPVSRAVITVPAYFNEPQRKATIRAGELAGLKVERIINEPTAASIAYGVHEAEDDDILLVFDLGGGTFDVSVIERFEGTLEVRASAGETFLGGEDFTGALVGRVLRHLGKSLEHAEASTPKLVSRLRRECELAKRELTKNETAKIRIPNDEGDLKENAKTVAVRREQFADWTQSLLSRTDVCIRRAMGDANLTKDDIHHVVLVGGATRMPSVIDHVEKLFGKPPLCRLNPDEVVARGAAIQAALIAQDKQVEDLVVTDVAPFTLGIEISRELGGRIKNGYFMPIITRNTTIPTSRVERVSTLQPNQREVRVKLYQGESRRVEGNLSIGEFIVGDIPSGPAGQEVDVRFTYDLNGVLEAEATVVATGKKASHVVTKFAKGLSKRDLKKSLEKMKELKFHPREETQNRFLLKRAERVYVELPLDVRNQLDDYISVFEDALERQEAGDIEVSREALRQFLDHFDPQEDSNSEDEYEQ